MNKAHILSEIKRTAKENGGTPLGWRRFVSETGIREADWLGRHWARWSDALREAGFEPNELKSAYEDSELLDRFIALTRKLGRLPANQDLRMESRADPTFPHSKTFSRLGRKQEFLSKVVEYCGTRPEFGDILALCSAYRPPRSASTDEPGQTETDQNIGFVYLIRSGRFYKIGRSNAAGRREREIALQLPEKSSTVHVIRTDDPVGIERYWHGRFDENRKNGEWFELSAADIAAFKRRKFM
jgi:hypothetical protein